MKQYQELSNTELRNTSGGFTFIIPVPVWQLKKVLGPYLK